MHEDLPLARRDLIASRLAQGQAVVAATLAAEFSVSEDAIRRDLRALAADGLCRRVYGGALPVSAATSPMAARIDVAAARKEALAKAALQTVQSGELLFLDSGSTNLALVDLLPDDADVTVATNSIDIAAAVVRRQDIKLVLIGGGVDLLVGGSVDAAAVQALLQLNIDRCFIGACSVSTGSGVSAFNGSDAAFKRAVLKQSRHSLVLATSEKMAMRAHHRIADLRDFEYLVVEHDLPTAELEELKQGGAVVLQAANP
ncbi:DeoR/GlpR family DNA-binding transcription regulator [Silvimonas amylolytica]|uniref:DeoR family transcriptional regulator n=1 Tax=Silvimonas amylolytica TaxID=449663 RepID=A0ABQ2PJA0_9NEIS|nr:DeoR/GlpR family DNA-binding transcription regulator [Silvimonas amylolytica]GGP25311.1 DeoR family transcriptional regulator [Silvimonas amylolytica]